MRKIICPKHLTVRSYETTTKKTAERKNYIAKWVLPTNNTDEIGRYEGGHFVDNKVVENYIDNLGHVWGHGHFENNIRS